MTFFSLNRPVCHHGRVVSGVGHPHISHFLKAKLTRQIANTNKFYLSNIHGRLWSFTLAEKWMLPEVPFLFFRWVTSS